MPRSCRPPACPHPPARERRRCRRLDASRHEFVPSDVRKVRDLPTGVPRERAARRRRRHFSSILVVSASAPPGTRGGRIQRRRARGRHHRLRGVPRRRRALEWLAGHRSLHEVGGGDVGLDEAAPAQGRQISGVATVSAARGVSTRRNGGLASTFLVTTRPWRGNGKVILAGKLSAVASGPEDAFRTVEPMVKVFAPRGVSYVGDGRFPPARRRREQPLPRA